MPRLSAADASLILDHVVGDPSFPAAFVDALLPALPFPDHLTPRLRRSLLLRRLDADPVSAEALDSLKLLASLPDPDPASSIAAAHLAVAGFLVVSAPTPAEFDAAVQDLFARTGGRAFHENTALASPDALEAAREFEAGGDAYSRAALALAWGNRDTALQTVRQFLAAEWAVIPPSRLLVAAEKIVGETWRAADQDLRAKLCLLVGKEKASEMLARIEDSISTPQVHKVMQDLKTSMADLHNAVNNPLPAAKVAADKVLAANLEKKADVNAEEVDIKKRRKDTPTAASLLREDSLDPDGSVAQPQRPHLPSPRRVSVSPLQVAKDRPLHRKARNWSSAEEEALKKGVSPLQVAKDKPLRRKARRWSSAEEEALKKGIEQFGCSHWSAILSHNADVFIGRTGTDLKDKWRNMMRNGTHGNG